MAIISANHPRIFLAALRGGAGKTTLAIGMIGAFKKLGKSVVPFKKGPDFIDAAWLAYAAGRPCYNLDSFLLGMKETALSLCRHVNPGDIAIVEGNRGLFDGMDVKGTHSTAELAKITGSPVVLIVDCTKSTRTVAAMILGCLKMDPKVHIAGVILNMVGTSRQELLVKTAVEEYCQVPVLGSIPRIRDNSLPERHMGLVPPFEHPEADRSVAAATGMVLKYVDLDELSNIAANAVPLKVPEILNEPVLSVYPHSPRIGIMRDSSFWFYYPENINALSRLGATLVEVNSITDRVFPQVDALYIGGGFPETHASALAANKPLRTALLKSIYDGLPVYAECGGLMYLGKSLILNGSEYPMVGAFPVSFTVGHRPQGHGYTELEAVTDNPYFSKGTIIRGHEFHYSRPIPLEPERLNMVFRNIRGSGFTGQRDGLCVMNTLALYSHIHASGEPGWAQALFKLAEQHNFFFRHDTKENKAIGKTSGESCSISGIGI